MKCRNTTRTQQQQNPKYDHFDDPPSPKPPETMTSWFERQISSHEVQLAAVAVLSGAAVAGAIYGSQAIRREKRVEELKASIPELSESHHANMVRSFCFFCGVMDGGS